MDCNASWQQRTRPTRCCKPGEQIVHCFFISSSYEHSLFSDRKCEIKYSWRAGHHFSREVYPERDTVDLQKISPEHPVEKWLELLTPMKRKEAFHEGGREIA